MKLDTGLFIELIYIAVLSGTLSVLLVQKIKEKIAWLEGIWVLLFSLVLNIGMAWLFLKTLVAIGQVYEVGAWALISLVGYIDAQVFYSVVKDKWDFFKKNELMPGTDEAPVEDEDGGR